MAVSSFFARQARKFLTRPRFRLSLETQRLEDRVVPSISGFVFQDFNANGAFDTAGLIENDGGTAGKANAGKISTAIDEGVSGVTVRVFDGSGALIDTQTTGPGGQWTSTATVAGQSYRVEFTGLPPGFFHGPHGLNNGTATQFVADGAKNVSLGLVRANDYFRDNPLLVTPVYVLGDQLLDTPVIVSFPYSAGSANPTAASNQANAPTFNDLAIPARQVGTTWGLAFNRQQQSIYASAFTKRHSNWGPTTANNPGGPGMIYRMDVPRNPTGTTPSVTNATPWFNLQGASALLDGTTPITVDTLGSFAVWGAARQQPGYDWLRDGDNTGWDAVGKTSLGGMDVNDDGTRVFVMNLADRRLYVIPVLANGAPDAANVRAFSLPTIAGVANQNDVRPFAVQFHRGLVYLGLVNSAESTVTPSNPAGDTTQLRGYVYTFDPATNQFSSTSVVTDGTGNGFLLNYPRGTSFGGLDDFVAWNPQFQRRQQTLSSGGPTPVKWPQAMVSGLAFDRNGNLMISIRDRAGDQTGNFIPDDPNFPTENMEGISVGDVLMAFTNVIGSTTSGFTLERNGASPVPGNPATGATGKFPGFNVAFGQNTGQGPLENPGAAPGAGNPAGEFFGVDFYGASTHTETSLGAVLRVPGFPDMVNTHFDPAVNGEFRTGGTRWFATQDGTFRKAYQVYALDQGGRGVPGGTFGKANGLGDLIAVEAEPPPIEIGNRIFRDDNRNGVQDANEPGLGGVTVELWLPGGTTPLATVVTAADGSYYFNSGPDPDPLNNPSHEVYGIQALAAGKNFEVRIPNAAGANQQVPLKALVLTKANVQTEAFPGDTNQAARNSDGLLVGTTAVIAVTAGKAIGQSNHDNDAGFAPGVSLGNFVWEDQNNNGLFDPGELGVSGIEVRLYSDANGDGIPDNPLPDFTTSTDPNGQYLFTGLAPGKYVVEITSPPGFRSSSGNPFDPFIGPFESGITVNTTNNNEDHGVTVGGDIFSGFIIRTKTVTLFDVGDSKNPDEGGNANLRQDFGIYRTYSLGNRVWNDQNNNGLFDPGESGIDGVTVSLYSVTAFDGDGQLIPGSTPLVSDVVTAKGGFYRFDHLIAGQYVVAITGKTGPLANFVSSTGGTSKTTLFEPPLNLIPAASKLDNRDEGSTGLLNLVRSGAITLGPGANAPLNETNLQPGLNPQGNLDAQADMTVDFGFYEPLSLGNQIWNDANNNGLLDPGELGIDGVSVSIFRADGSGKIIGTALETQSTKNGGFYLFTGLGTDNYVVRVDTSTLPAGYWVSSSGKNGSASGPFEPGADPNTDRRDGIDRGTFVSGTAVQSGAVALSPGTAPPNVPPTPGFTDTDNPLNSNRTIDFGFFQPLSLGNFVWNDANNSGKFETGEAGIDGVTVNLYSDDNNSGSFEPAFDSLVATTITKAGGLYLFQNLIAGGYFVEILPPAGFTSSTGSPGSPTGPYEPGITAFLDNEDHGTNFGSVIRSGLVPLALGKNPSAAPIFGDLTADGNRNYTIDFGIFQTLTVGNLVWNDLNNDGKFDSTEPGIAGVVVELLNNKGVVIQSTLTDAKGLYAFVDLSAGEYSVRIVPPAGFVSSTGKLGSATGPYEPGVSGNQNNEDHGTQAGQFVAGATFTLFPAGDPRNPDNGGAANLRQDFGLFVPLALGDLVWVDRNNNGKLDAGEQGLAGVPVTLLDATGTITIATTVTDANGQYGFGFLVPGTYVVSIAPGKDFVSSTGKLASAVGPYEPGVTGDQNSEDHGTQFDAVTIRSTVTLGAPGTNPDQAGNANLRQDFGVFQPMSLGDFIWEDKNNNGKFDSGEQGLAGVVVTLLDAGGNKLASTTTDANGQYGFGFLVPGKYTVRVTPPPGFATSTGKNGSATGPYEPGVTGNQNDEDHGTRSNGFVETVVVLAAPGDAANPDSGGLANLRQDFGLFQPISVGSFVWVDANDNGKFDSGEQPLGGIPVTLLDSNNNQIASTVTDKTGAYLFSNLLPGSYYVSILPLPGVLPSSTSTNPLASGNNENVGTAGPNGTIVSPIVNLTLGGGPLVGGNTDPNAYITFDFGLLALGSLSGFVYFDVNLDGVYSPGPNADQPIPGVTITLTGQDANGDPLPVQTTVTNASGLYEFLNLPPGKYTITQTQPAGYYYSAFDTPGNLGGFSPGTNVLTVQLGANQDGVNYNFGEVQPAFVMGYVWVDSNTNCQKDPGELGVANVPVTISGLAFAGTQLQQPLTAALLPPGFSLTVFTDASGYYAFPVLPPGTYLISRGDLPVEVRNIYANWCLQNGDPNPNPPTAGDQQFSNVRLGLPVRGPFNFGVIPINPNDPSKRNFLGSSPNVPNLPNPNLPPPGGPTRGPVPLNPSFATKTSNPQVPSLVLVGTGVGQRAVVRVLDYAVGAEKFRFEPYGAYTGGVRVAQGDVNGDGVPDIITSTGQGGGPRIRVFDGASGKTLLDFFAYEESFRGGVFVAAADLTGDGKAEIIAGTESGGGPRVRVFDVAASKVIHDFFAFDENQRGGVRVAVADFNNDQRADIVATTGASVPTRVRIFDGQNLKVLQDYTPYGATFTGGANIAVGDFNGDGQADVIVGTEAGGGPRVQIYNGKDASVLADFFAFESTLRSGVRVGARDINGDGKAEIVVTSGMTGAARIRILRAQDLTPLEDFFALDPEFRGGAYVG